MTRLVSANLDRFRAIDVVYTDLDGTMLGPRGSFLHAPDGTPSLEPVTALLDALRAGIDIVPVSGRALRGLQTDARLLGMANCIAEMGALLSYDFGNTVVNNFGETPGDEWPADVMTRVGALDALLEHAAGRLEPHAPWAAWRQCTHLLRGLVDTAAVNEFLRAHGFGWLVLHDNGRLHGSYVGLPMGASRAYHLQPRGVTKGLAVKLDRERRDIARERAIAIGDSFADLELATEVGTFVLVGDALDNDPALAAAVETLDNVFVTERAMNLGWTDVLRACVRAR